MPYREGIYSESSTSHNFNFIWNKSERIKRNTLIGNVRNGGLGIIDVESKLKALKAVWLLG